MTTEREYQEGKRRIRKQHQQKSNPSLWIFMGIIVFSLLIFLPNYQKRSTITTPATSEQVNQ